MHVHVYLPDDDTGIISRRFGAEELPLITAVLKRLFALVVIFLLKPPKPNIFIYDIWPAILCLWRRDDVDELADDTDADTETETLLSVTMVLVQQDGDVVVTLLLFIVVVYVRIGWMFVVVCRSFGASIERESIGFNWLVMDWLEHIVCIVLLGKVVVVMAFGGAVVVFVVKIVVLAAAAAATIACLLIVSVMTVVAAVELTVAVINTVGIL